MKCEYVFSKCKKFAFSKYGAVRKYWTQKASDHQVLKNIYFNGLFLLSLWQHMKRQQYEAHPACSTAKLHPN
jgi:hypothetical protein